VLRQKARAAVLVALRSVGGEGDRKSILTRATEVGNFTAPELLAPPPAGTSGHPRLVDHDLSWALSNLKRDGLVENPRWSIWRLTSNATVPDEPTVDDPAPTNRLAELRAMPYWEYLRTPEWRRTRAAALVRADHSCAMDASHTTDLEVHHRIYDRLGAELATDLTVLCQACHRLHHDANGRPRRQRPESP
jgi:restriction endonuclease Mrr